MAVGGISSVDQVVMTSQLLPLVEAAA